MTYISDKKDGNGNTLVAFGDSASIDAFGRIRTSDPFTEFDSNFQYDKQTVRWLESATGSAAAATHLPNRASVAMSIGTDSGARVRRWTRTNFRYQPGKSLEVLCTFVLEPKANVRQRVGYFDQENGIFLEAAGTTYNMVRRTYASGSAVDNSVAQASWNIDPMDGTGPSGVTLDFTKSQILVIDMEWLGVGRVRVGFAVDGAIYYAHQFLNANTLDVVYMTTANLPLTYEIENTGIAASATILEQICSTVVSEGGFNPEGFVREASNANTGVSIASGTMTPVLSIRLKSAYQAAQLIPQTLGVLGVTANRNIYWAAYERTTLTGASFAAASDAVEFDVAASAFSGGTKVAGGYISPEVGTVSTVLTSDLPLSNDGTNADIFTIAAMGIGGTATAYGSVRWREVW